MLYRKNTKNGDELSQLGFGCMRIQRKGAATDVQKATELIRSAINKGINYFDTAYMYPGNEAALGVALAGGYREKVKIATKLPVILTKSAADINKFFNKSLERLKTDYIDYYLMHMLTDLDSFEKLLSFGFEDWVSVRKKSGSIRNIGFSFHGRQDSFKSIIDAYDWDFCMIQYNYLDEYFQAGTGGLMHAYGKGVPVIVMEPLRGGQLVNLPDAAKNEFEGAVQGRSAAQWGLRWVLDCPEVTMLLSGMGSIEQLEENCKLASETTINCLNEAEKAAYGKVCDIIRTTTKVNCTGCGYCMPCPFGVDIPNGLSALNESVIKKKSTVTMNYMMSAGISPKNFSFASQCKKCGKCEKHCPQNIPISEHMTAVSNEIEKFWIKPAAKMAKAIMGRNK